MQDELDAAEWTELAARASFASHRLIGWIFWDPGAIERYAALGVPDGFGYYIASRAAPLAPAGHGAVTAAFYSIHAGAIEACLALAAQHTTWERITAVRDAAVAEGLRATAPEIVDDLSELAGPLWRVVDELPASGRVLFAAHRDWPRSDDPLVGAWLALNCIREWRGDTHFAILAAEDVSGVEAGLLHNEHLGYPDEWIPRSRGADDAALELAWERLERRGLADSRRVTEAGRRLRTEIEERTDRICTLPWQLFGRDRTVQLLDVVEPVGERFLSRIDRTAGENWMPAARSPRHA